MTATPISTPRYILGGVLLAAIPFELAYLYGPGSYVLLAAFGFAALFADASVTRREAAHPNHPVLSNKQHTVLVVVGFAAVIASIAWGANA